MITALSAELACEKIDHLKQRTTDAIDEHKTFSGTVEGMLIELLRQVTFKIKVMDYIAKNAFADNQKSSRAMKRGLKHRIKFTEGFIKNAKDLSSTSTLEKKSPGSGSNASPTSSPQSILK